MKKEGLPSDLCAVELGMRYGNPSIAEGLDRLRGANCEKILVLPLYPQYAASTTASTLDAVGAYFASARRVPALRFVDSFHDDPGYIRALAKTVNQYWEKHGRPDRLVLSFHGVPKRSLIAGDPYHCYCHVTARLLADEIGLEKKDWVACFQSRFGRGECVEPVPRSYTLTALAREGARRVRCNAARASSPYCLEGRSRKSASKVGAYFKKAGARSSTPIACLNEQPAWMAALTDLSFRQL
jgi:ferrochelatase